MSPTDAAASASPPPAPSPARAPLDVGADAGGDVIVTGLLADDGGYRVLADGREVDPGVIPDIDARIPGPWTRLDDAWTSPQLSDTGYLAFPLVSGPNGDENHAIGVFDLQAPQADPLVIPVTGSAFRFAGDRLWARTDEQTFAVRDDPWAVPSTVTTPNGMAVEVGRTVPFYLTAAGDAVLVREGDGLEPRLLGVDGADRPVPGDQEWLTATGAEVPFGPGGASFRSAACNPPTATAVDVCVVDEAGNATAYDVPGNLVEVAWDPGEEQPVWMSTDGVGTITGGMVKPVVRLATWVPDRIAGFWSNVVILASATPPRVAFAYTGPDSITELPMPPESIVALPGDSLLRVVPGADVPDG